MRLAAAPLALLLLAGCPEPVGPQPPSCEADAELPADELHASVDGDAFVGDNTMLQALATGVQMGFTLDATNGMTLRLVESSVYSIDELTEAVVVDDGDDAVDLFDDRTDADYQLGDGSRDGADVTLIDDGATLHTSNVSDEGFLRITFEEDEDTGVVTMRGCGWFDAEAQDGSAEASVTDMTFAVTIQ